MLIWLAQDGLYLALAPCLPGAPLPQLALTAHTATTTLLEPKQPFLKEHSGCRGCRAQRLQRVLTCAVAEAGRASSCGGGASRAARGGTECAGAAADAVIRLRATKRVRMHLQPKAAVCSADTSSPHGRPRPSKLSLRPFQNLSLLALRLAPGCARRLHGTLRATGRVVALRALGAERRRVGERAVPGAARCRSGVQRVCGEDCRCRVLAAELVGSPLHRFPQHTMVQVDDTTQASSWIRCCTAVSG